MMQERVVLPAEFFLGNNYPNPFNPTTTIEFGVPDIAKGEVQVTLEVFNTRGQKIRTLVNESRQAGSYSVTWDSRNDFGRAVSSGVYFYRMQAGNFMESKKLILLR